MADPPLLAGAMKETEACALPPVAVTPVGGPGTVAGVTEFDGADAGPVPTEFAAVTVKVYEVPLVSPVTTCVVEVLPALVSTPPAGFEVTVYPVIAAPPLLAGAVKETVACALPPVAVTPMGAPGTVAGVTEFDGADAGPVPAELLAVTVNVYAVPLVRPVTT